jgi:hypothetical protein
MPGLFAVAQRPDAPNRTLTCDTARNWRSLVATKQGGFKMEVRAPPTLCTDLTHRIAHGIRLHAHAPRLSAFPPTHRINVVCAAEQTANGSLSTLFSNPETRRTVRSPCFAALPRCWDRAGPGPCFSQPTLETTFVNNRETGQRKRCIPSSIRLRLFWSSCGSSDSLLLTRWVVLSTFCWWLPL